jgi:putative ABC transport system ATP-binding protein
MLRDLNEKHGKTLIIVTHDQNIAKQAPRTISLRDGKIICDDYNKCFDEKNNR